MVCLDLQVSPHPLYPILFYNAMPDSLYDFIIVGGGLAGCALASRLHQGASNARILILEAGPDASSDPMTEPPLACFALHKSDLDWNYATAPQQHLDGATRYAAAGKALGGGSVINYGTWTKGSSSDYDRWAQVVGDERWNYENLLPFMKRTEKHFASATDDVAEALEHGHYGPVQTASVTSSSSERAYPLRDAQLQAWKTSGVDRIADANSGSPLGVAELVENWRDGKRQITSSTYPMSGIDMKTNTVVQKVLSSKASGKLTATGVQLTDGSEFHCNHSVILSCGAYRTPQLLMLSGIGPSSILSSHSITPLLDQPHVGTQFHDHLDVSLCFRLKHPEQGLSAGSPLWTSPSYNLGLPCDWLVTTHLTHPSIRSALRKDGIPETDLHNHYLLQPTTPHIETIVVYAPAGAPLVNTHVPMDGKAIGAVIVNLEPTSRGSISISSNKVEDPPVIDPNYNATYVDQVMLREGVRQVVKFMYDTPQMKDVVSAGLPPVGMPDLTLGSSDEEIDERIRKTGQTTFHPGGGCAMGKVVDAECKVMGVEGLRVVDASVLPVPIGAHYQVPVYAVGERVAEMILRELKA